MIDQLIALMESSQMAANVEVSAKCRRLLADDIQVRLGVSNKAAELFAIRANLSISAESYDYNQSKVHHLIALMGEFVHKAVLALEAHNFDLDRETVLASMQAVQLSV